MGRIDIKNLDENNELIGEEGTFGMRKSAQIANHESTYRRVGTPEIRSERSDIKKLIARKRKRTEEFKAALASVISEEEATAMMEEYADLFTVSEDVEEEIDERV